MRTTSKEAAEEEAGARKEADSAETSGPQETYDLLQAKLGYIPQVPDALCSLEDRWELGWVHHDPPPGNLRTGRSFCEPVRARKGSGFTVGLKVKVWVLWVYA